MTQVDSWQGATILASAEDELIGKTLNATYSVERLLGEGGMGRVYQARHTRIAQKRVAVKVLHREYVRNAEVLARFQREAETAASISHPNVVAVYDVDRTARGLPYLVSEYLEGFDLGQYLKQEKTLNLKTAIHIARQLCDGLSAAHRCGVIHRDLKPSNVFLLGDASGQVPELPFIKILDFGLSKFVDASSYGQLVTEAGMIMGTPAFMPPEQAQGMPADHRSDVYGVGALLYNFLTGRLPFNEATPQATVLAVIGTAPPNPRELVATIPESTEQIILRAMAKQPEARYQSMSEFLTALESESKDSIVRYDGKSSVRDSLDTQSERSGTARPRLVLGLGLALTLLLGSTAVAIAGLERAAGWALTRLELGLSLLCGAAVAVTPVVLVARWIRRRVWNDGKRVFELSSAVRTAAVTAVATYGLGWFASRIFDGVALRLMGKPVQVDLSWPGWDFLLTLIGVGAGVVALLRERALTDALSGWRRVVVATLALLATLSLAGFIIPVGLRWQEQQTNAARARSQAAAKARKENSAGTTTQPVPAASPIAAPAIAQLLEAASQPEPAVTTAQQEPSQPSLAENDPSQLPSPPAEVVASQPLPAPAPSATEEELRAAAARGVEGWVSLAETYPNDPHVLRPLVLGHASRAAELSQSMSAARRLFQVAPQETTSTDLQYLVVKAAESRGAAAELAWKMLAEDMGTVGLDLLYSMTLTKPRLAERAEQLLASPAMANKISPALAIARELRHASSCAQRLPLLERALEVGDERAIMALGALSTGASKGCGKNKRKACLPACPEQAEQFRSAMNKISSRLKAARN